MKQGKIPWNIGTEKTLQKLVSCVVLAGLVCGCCIGPVTADLGYAQLKNPLNLPSYPQIGYAGTIHDDWANSVVEDTDGEFVLTGCTKEWGAGALYVMKTDRYGIPTQIRGFGGQLQDDGYSIRQTRDGDYIVAGVVRYWGDREVDIDWANTLLLYQTTGIGGVIYFIYDIFSDIFGDDTCNKFYVLRVDKDLNLVGDHWFSWKGADMAYCVQEASDGGIVAVGTEGTSSAGANVLLIKYDAGLYQELWKREYPNMQHRDKDDVGRWVEETADGGFIITGFTKSYLSKNNFDILLLKTDSEGNQMWSRPILPNTLTKDDVGNCVKQTPDGGYIIVGSTKSYTGGKSTDILLVKVTGDGDVEWRNKFDGGGNDIGNALSLTPDGGYIIAGGTETERGDSDIWVIKTDGNGEMLWEKTIGDEVSNEVGNSIEPTADGGYVIAGVQAIPTDTFEWGGETITLSEKDSYLVKLQREPVVNLTVEKAISKDSTNWTHGWIDAANGNKVSYYIGVQNFGDYPLSNIEVVDNGNLITTIPELEPGEAAGPFFYDTLAQEGNHQNTAVVTAWYDPDEPPITAEASTGYHASQVFVPSFTASPSTGTVPLTVLFNDTSTGAPTAWAWHFHDNGSVDSFEKNTSHTFYQPGTYRIYLTVSNEIGYATASRDITLNTAHILKPSASFIANRTSGPAPFAVRFTDTSTGSPTTCSWQFGDGTSATNDHEPVHVYQQAGTYTVKLSIGKQVSSLLLTDSMTKTNFITVTQPQVTPPAADFTAVPTTGNAPLAVNFTDTSTGSPTAWEWQFGDGTGSDLQNPGHLYQEAGDYTITLTASNSVGQDTRVRIGYIHVSPPEYNPPDAAFDAAPLSGQAPLDVHFNDRSTGSPTSWFWSFGDTWFTETQNPDHTYTKPGNYTVMLTIRNATGSDNEVKTSYIHVYPGEQPSVSADFTGSPVSGLVPLDVSFSSICPGTAVSWFWVFGDGSNSTAALPVHTYSSPGKYSVSLIMKNARNEMVLVSKPGYINVTEKAPEPPIADFSATPTSGYKPLIVTFTDRSAGSPTSWYWRFGDGSDATAQNPVHTYTLAGNYTVNLTASNSAGSHTLVKFNYISVREREPTSTGISLVPGWNFISVPVRLEAGADTVQLFDGVDTASHTIWTFDGSQRKWVAMGAASQVNALDGVWIFSSGSSFVPLYYSENPLQAPPSKPLAKGWNCIGFGGTIPASARDAFLSAGEDWTQAIGFDAGTQKWETAVVNGGSGAFADSRVLYPFRGYWLYASHDSELASLGA